jgi:DNA-binding IclR family transcriptional regulator
MKEEQSDPSTNEQARVSMADILALPDELQMIVTCLMRHGEAGLSEVTTFIAQDEATTHSLLADLVAQGFVQEVSREGEGQPRYRLHLAAKRGRRLPLDL